MKNEKSNDGKKDEGDTAKETITLNNNDNLWGSDMYPERRGAKQTYGWFNWLIGVAGRESIDKTKCEDNVYRCIKDSTISFIYARGWNKKSKDINLLFLYFLNIKSALSFKISLCKEWTFYKEKI